MIRSRWLAFCRLLLLHVASLGVGSAFAQGGPPMQTDDPGTPGNGNWEINVAVTSERRYGERRFEAPLFDINYGIGDRLQLKFEVPYVVQGWDALPTATGWGNSMGGVKWRFYQNDKLGFNVSTYPQLEFTTLHSSIHKGLVEQGVRFLLPLQFTKTVGPLDTNLEFGYSFANHAEDEWLLGFAVGREITRKLELAAELYNTGVAHEGNETTFDFGTRYKLGGPFTLLLMAGRSFSGSGSGQPHFIGYGGLQINLERSRNGTPAIE